MTYKEYLHNPPHYFIQNGKYFITGATYQKKRYLKNPASKNHLITSLSKACKKYNWQLEDWVILDNHYHLMLNAPEEVKTLSELIKEVHRFSALWIKKHILRNKHQSIIWYNYWDSCIDYESSYFARLHYIWFNPVKHKYVQNAEDWEYGSYRGRLLKYEDSTKRVIKKYPCDQIKIRDNF